MVAAIPIEHDVFYDDRRPAEHCAAAHGPVVPAHTIEVTCELFAESGEVDELQIFIAGLDDLSRRLCDAEKVARARRQAMQNIFPGLTIAEFGIQTALPSQAAGQSRRSRAA